MAIYRLSGHAPHIPASAYVSPEAVVIGRVTLGENVAVMPGAVIRADNETIVIGDNSNVQDGAVLHVDPGCPMSIGAYVTIGHQAMLHGCTIGDCVLVGIQAIILNKAGIGGDSLVAAGAVVLEGKTFPERSLIVGTPAVLRRGLSDADIASVRASADAYIARAKLYKTNLERMA